MAETKQTVEKIDLYRYARPVARQLRRLWWLVLLLALVFGGLFGLQARRSYAPRYQATATYAASSGVSGITDIASGTSYYDSQLREQIVESFPYIMDTEGMQERVKNILGLAYIPGTVRVEAVGDTNFYKLTVTASDSADALNTLKAVAESFPEAASFVIGGAVIEEIEPPRAADTPINALSVRKQVEKGALVGLILGLLIACALGVLRIGVASEQDLKSYTRLSCLGNIPTVKLKKRRKHEPGLISLLNPRLEDSLSSCFGELRLRLLRQMERTDPRGNLLVVTSTCASEGKTTVSSNLAISLARSGKRVILVDADLRNQTVKNRLGVSEPTRGLLELIRKPSLDPEKQLVKIGELPLYLLAGDEQMASPMRLLESDRTGEVLNRLRALADVVILDAPPAGLLADAAVLGARADFALFVIRCDGVGIRQAADAMQELQQQKVSLLGYVLNGRSDSESGSYGAYGRYGKYGNYGKYGRYGNYSHYGAGNTSGKKSRK